MSLKKRTGAQARGRSGNRRRRVYGTPPEPPAEDTAWPPQWISKGWGLTLNGPDWEARAEALWQLLDDLGWADEWTWSRIEVRGDSLEPTAGTYSYTAVAPKVAWCRSHGIRPVLDYTYFPPYRVYNPTFSGVTITNQTYTKIVNNVPTTVTRARMVGADMGFGEFSDVTVQATAGGGNLFPDGAQVANDVVNYRGQVGSVPYITLDQAAPGGAIGSGRTLIFGPYTAAGGHRYAGEQDRHLAPIDTDANLKAIGKAVAALAVHFSTGDIDTEIVIEVFNEANGQFWRPRQDHGRYLRMFRNIYRAVMEAAPTVAVALTGASGNAGHNPDTSWGLDAPDWHEAIWNYMLADGVWADWLEDEDGTFTSFSKPANNMAALLATGRISSRIYCDFAGFHAYAFGRTGNSLGAANYQSILGTASTGVAAKFVRMLNMQYAKDPTPGKTGLNRMKWLSTETGPPTHPLAVTGRGNTGLGAGRNTAPVKVASTASSEEAAGNVTFEKQLHFKHRAFPTGGGIPTITSGVGDPRDRWAILNYQRLSELAESYSGADAFLNQGWYTNVAAAGPPAVGSGVLKVAVGADATARQYLTSGIYSDASIGTVRDIIEAFGHPWAEV